MGGAAPGRPAVSVIAAVLDERDHIDDVLASLQAQDYDGPIEVVVADGGSTDGTLDALERWTDKWPAVRVIHNERCVQSHGLNDAARVATGTVLVRADGHTTYATDYVARSVQALLGSEAVAVGGNQTPVGLTPTGRAIADVMRSPAGVGPGAFHHAREVREADTVYLGAFRRDDFLAIGGYRHLPSGTTEDADLFYRLRRAGGLVLLDPSIRSVYRTRDRISDLWFQSVRYGLGKAEFLWVESRFPSWRPLAPLVLVLGLVAGGVLASRGRSSPLAVTTGGWLGVIGSVVHRSSGTSAHRRRVAVVTTVMQLGYGVGLLWGLMRGPAGLEHLDRTA